MKIGRIDVTVPMLAYLLGVAAGCMALLVMWLSHAELRYESWYRGRILQAIDLRPGETVLEVGAGGDEDGVAAGGIVDGGLDGPHHVEGEGLADLEHVLE